MPFTRFALPEVIAAIKAGSVTFSGTRAFSPVRDAIGNTGSVSDFALAVFSLLTAGKALDGVTLNGERFDVYGIRLPLAVRAAFNVTTVSWYVKFTMRANATGKSVYVISLHPAEITLPPAC